jgi:hypothetical protein
MKPLWLHNLLQCSDLVIWSNGNWVNRFKLNYEYENALLSMFFQQIWSNNNWLNMYRCIYTYNYNNLIEGILVEDWYGGWVNHSRISYTYNSNNDLINILWEYWDPVWVNRYKLTLDYDNYGNMITEMFESWDNMLPTTKHIFTFDVRHNCTRGEAYRLENNNWVQIGGDFTIYYNNKNDSLELHSAKWVDVVYDPPLSGADEQIKFRYLLQNNYPNPFNPSTRIIYSIAEHSNVLFKIFDILGNEVETLVNEEQSAGTYNLEFNASDLPSGVYFYQLRTVTNYRHAESFIETKKMILIK